MLGQVILSYDKLVQVSPRWVKLGQDISGWYKLSRVISGLVSLGQFGSYYFRLCKDRTD